MCGSMNGEIFKYLSAIWCDYICTGRILTTGHTDCILVPLAFNFSWLELIFWVLHLSSVLCDYTRSIIEIGHSMSDIEIYQQYENVA